MEEDIKILKSYIKAIDTFGTIDYKCINNLYNPVKNILNELERLQKENTQLKNDNEALQMTHEYDVKMIDEVKGEYVKLSKEFKVLDCECSRLERKEIELENENRKYRLETIPRLDGEIQAYKQRIDELLSDTCLHCNENTPMYCENCYQELITKNAELQTEIEQEKQYYIKKCRDCTELSFKLDNCIPKQVIRDKIEELKKQNDKEPKGTMRDFLDNEVIRILQELLGDE